MKDSNKQIYDEFEKEIVVLHLTTVVRLFDLSANAATLYLFYVKTAKIQKTNSIWATNIFCKRGLGWGDKTLKDARKSLKTFGFIEDKVDRDKNGKIKKHYTVIHYLKNNGLTENHSVDNTISGYKESNAVDENLNAKEEESNDSSSCMNENTTIYEGDPHEKIFSYWNSKTNLLKDDTLLAPGIKRNVTVAMKRYSYNNIIKAIDNYSIILSKDKYFFKHKWTFSEFFARAVLKRKGSSKKSGLVLFLPENKPLQVFSSSSPTTEFKPICFVYNKIYDDTAKQYYGIDIYRFNELESLMYEVDTVREPKYYHFEDLEVIIAGLLFSKRASPRPELVKKYIELWKKWKPKFKKQVAERLKVSGNY